MRNFTLTILAIVTVFTSCGPTVEDAINYNDYIIGQNDQIQEKFNQITERI